jgi:hypothetical protein
MADNLDYTKLLETYAKAINAAEVATLLFLQGKIQFRVHNRGEKTSGELIGGYSKKWAAKRTAKGRQVNYVDLEFNGDLRKGMKVGVDGKVNVLQFINEAETDKGRGNEDAFGGPIWNASPEEIENAMISYNAVLNKTFNDNL